jgi:serine protease Do
MEGSGAAEAGVQPDDLIVSVDGKTVATQFSLISAIRKYRPGDTVRIGIERSEEQLEVSATLGRVADFDPNVIEFQGFIGGELSMRRTGFPSVIQHDTVLLPNQCGGPVVDLDGRFVGINIARADRTASYIIPAVSIRPLIDDLKRGKYSPTTRLTSRN